MMKIIICFAVLLICFSTSLTANANSKLEALPEVSTLDINDFVKNSSLVTKAFENDPSLDFQIQVPKSFSILSDDKLKNVNKNDVIYGEIFAAYGASSGDLRPYLKVHSMELERLISAKNWIVTKSLEWGYTLRGIRAEDDEGNAVDAFYIRLDTNGNTEIVRARAFLHQNRLILVEFVLPVSLWEQGRDTQIYTVQSFEFKNTFVISSPEPMANFSYLDNFYFEYPESWRLLRRDVDNVNSVDVTLKTSDANGFLLADANLTVLSAKSLRDRVDQMVYPLDLPEVLKARMQYVDEQGYDIDPIMEHHKYDLAFEEAFQTTEVYPLRRKNTSVYVTETTNDITKEFWLTVIKRPNDVGKNYVVSMIAPSRTVNLYQWAVAVKAYEEMVKTIR